LAPITSFAPQETYQQSIISHPCKWDETYGQFASTSLNHACKISNNLYKNMTQNDIRDCLEPQVAHEEGLTKTLKINIMYLATMHE
jgi:hypothetical protein